MAINFPDSPTDGQQFTLGSSIFVYDAARDSWTKKIGSQVLSDLVDVDDAGVTLDQHLRYTGIKWMNTDVVEGFTTYATVAALPVSGNKNGDLTFVTENNRIYIWNDGGWYSIALLNLSPTAITGNAASYDLELDGTPLVITLVSEDPDGFSLTWSHSITSGTLGSTATIEQADNVFTITPSTDASNGGTFTITFTVTEGVNIVTSIPSQFTLTFFTPPVLTVSPDIGGVSTFDLDSVDIVNFVAGTQYTITNNTAVDITMSFEIAAGKGGGLEYWGGQGGRSEGDFTLAAGQSVFAIAGTQGGHHDYSSSGDDWGGSGGGGSGVWDSANTYLVAGGGGGMGGADPNYDQTKKQGGYGGGSSGGDGAEINGYSGAYGGSGATQSAVGAGGYGSRGSGSAGSGNDGGDAGGITNPSTPGIGFGEGGIGGYKSGDGHAGGGGAGYYGGGGGGNGSWGNAGGGGSGYVNSTYITNGSLAQNQNAGNGYIIITKAV